MWGPSWSWTGLRMPPKPLLTKRENLLSQQTEQTGWKTSRYFSVQHSKWMQMTHISACFLVFKKKLSVHDVCYLLRVPSKMVIPPPVENKMTPRSGLSGGSCESRKVLQQNLILKVGLKSLNIFHGNLRGPPQDHVYLQEIARPNKALLRETNG